MIPVNLPSELLLPHAVSKRWSLVCCSYVRMYAPMSVYLNLGVVVHNSNDTRTPLSQSIKRKGFTANTHVESLRL